MAVSPHRIGAHAGATIAELLGELATERDRAHHADLGVVTDLGPSRLVHLANEALLSGAVTLADLKEPPPT